MKRAVAILETMWDWNAETSEAGYDEAPRYFRINPDNHSGKRLYKLIGPGTKLLVTEACRELASHANGHGKPDPEWLAENLRILDGAASTPHGGRFQSRIDLLLVCGKVAQRTYEKCEYKPKRAAVTCIPHPAARMWTRQMIEETQAAIQTVLSGF